MRLLKLLGGVLGQGCLVKDLLRNLELLVHSLNLLKLQLFVADELKRGTAPVLDNACRRLVIGGWLLNLGRACSSTSSSCCCKARR